MKRKNYLTMNVRNLKRNEFSDVSNNSKTWNLNANKKTITLRIVQNSQENTYVRVSFLEKLQVWGLQLY